MNWRLFLYSLMMLFVYVADGMMSYVSPVLIEARMHNTLVMGLILSSSSLTGLVADMLISKFFVFKEYQFFSRWLIGLALFFPLAFLILPPEPVVFLIAMAVWGIYYEFIAFSQYNFISRTVAVQGHATAWSILDSFKAAGLITAPLLTAYLLDRHENYVLVTVMMCLVLAAIVFVVLKKMFPATQQVLNTEHTSEIKPRSFVTELKTWAILMKKIWPVYTFFLVFIFLETSLWTLGPLLMEEVRHDHILSGWLLSAYLLPSFFVSLYAEKLGTTFGKKRTAFVSAIIGAFLLAIGAWFFSHEWFFTLIMFVSAMFLSLDYPEMEAVFANYISRVEGYGNDIVGLHGTASSLSYIIGPTLAGGLAVAVGPGKSIGIFAAILGLVSAILLWVTPRKIRMPQAELSEANQSD